MSLLPSVSVNVSVMVIGSQLSTITGHRIYAAGKIRKLDAPHISIFKRRHSILHGIDRETIAVKAYTADISQGKTYRR